MIAIPIICERGSSRSQIFLPFGDNSGGFPFFLQQFLDGAHGL